MTPDRQSPDGKEATGAPRVDCSPEETAELYELAAAQCVGPLSPQQTARLEQLVLGRGGLRHRYIVYMQLHAQAEQAWAATRGGAAEVPPGRPALLVPPGRRDLLFPPGRRDLLADETASIPFVLDDSEVPPGRRDLLVPPGRRDLLPGGVLLAYTLAALLLGSGVLAGLAWRTSGPGHVVQGPTDSRTPTVAAAVVEPPGTVHVSMMEMDCRWAHPATAQADMRHGKFELADGMLEITYQGTDRKVLLIGPATYFVDSSDSGALAAGRLFSYYLAKPDAKTILAHPLFRVRTPTTIVIDGGGSEFEIDANNTPSTHVLVLRGRAEVQLAGRTKTRTLQASDSLLVRRMANHGLAVYVDPDKHRLKPLFAQGLPKYRPFASREQKPTMIEIEKAPHGPFPDS